MKTATLHVTYNPVPGFPPATVADHVEATVAGTSGSPISQNVPLGTTEIVFPDLPVDAYTFHLLTVDPEGTALFTLNGSFEVTGSPDTISVTVANNCFVTLA